MKKGAPVDAMPEFEPLTIASSNLMIEANALRAQGEIFESAVKWVEAGRKLAELGTRLLHAGYTYEAARDVLNSAACFLEAGDHRPAEEQLERFHKLPELKDILHSNKFMADEFTHVSEWHAKRFQELEKARRESSSQVQGDATRFDRLKEAWLVRTLTALPGVPELHFIAAERYWTHDRRDKAIDHNRWSVRLRPFHVPFRVLLILHLSTARKWNEAISASDESMHVCPRDPFLLWFAAWARLEYVLRGSGPKKLLQEAEVLLTKAIKLAPRNAAYLQVGLRCTLAACLDRLGNTKKALAELVRVAGEFPSPAADIAWQMAQVSAEKRRAIFSNASQLLIGPALRAAKYDPTDFLVAA